MTDFNDIETIEATEEQLTMLRELGVSEPELEDMGYDEAEEMIAELRALRENAGPSRA